MMKHTYHEDSHFHIIACMHFRISPIGICSLIAGKLVEMEDIAKTFESLAYLIVTTITGIALQALIVYPIIYFIFVRKNPFRYMFNLQAAMFTAFGTDSRY